MPGGRAGQGRAESGGQAVKDTLLTVQRTDLTYSRGGAQKYLLFLVPMVVRAEGGRRA